MIGDVSMSYIIFLELDNCLNFLRKVTPILLKHSCQLKQIQCFKFEDKCYGFILLTQIKNVDSIVNEIRSIYRNYSLIYFGTTREFVHLSLDMHSFRKAFEKIISTLGVTYGSVFIHRLGYEHGFELATHIKSSIQMKEIREYLTLLTSILKSIGLVYDMEVVKIEKDNYTFKLIKPINSVYVRGILTGFISNIIGKQYSSFEIKLSDNEYIVTIAPY